MSMKKCCRQSERIINLVDDSELVSVVSGLILGCHHWIDIDVMCTSLKTKNSWILVLICLSERKNYIYASDLDEFWFARIKFKCLCVTKVIPRVLKYLKIHDYFSLGGFLADGLKVF